MKIKLLTNVAGVFCCYWQQPAKKETQKEKR